MGGEEIGKSHKSGQIKKPWGLFQTMAEDL